VSTPPVAAVRALSPEEERDWGGFTLAAELLTSLLGQPVSRQRVYSWWRWRKSNGFPDRHIVRISRGRVKNWFEFREIREWAASRPQEQETEGSSNGDHGQPGVPSGDASGVPGH
jgi:hypothetical protein